jgi:hypothetical protein
MLQILKPNLDVVESWIEYFEFQNLLIFMEIYRCINFKVMIWMQQSLELTFIVFSLQKMGLQTLSKDNFYLWNCSLDL